MRWPCVRFTVRRLMAAGALGAMLLACGTWAIRLARLAAGYRWHAELHALQELDWAEEAELLEGLFRLDVGKHFGFPAPGRSPEVEAVVARAKALWPAYRRGENRPSTFLHRDTVFAIQYGEAAERAAYHAGLRAKDRRAASRPWEAVPPDTPEPVWPGWSATNRWERGAREAAR